MGIMEREENWKALDEDYQYRCTTPEEMRRFIASPAWKDCKDNLEAQLYMNRNELEDFGATPTIEEVRMLQAEALTLRRIIIWPFARISDMEEDEKQEEPEDV